MQGVKVEAVVVYADPLTTQSRLVGISSAFPKGKQHGCFSSFLDITRSESHKIVQISRGERLLMVFRTFCHVVYATKGLSLFRLVWMGHYTSSVSITGRPL